MYKTINYSLDTERTVTTAVQNTYINTNDAESVKIVCNLTQDGAPLDLAGATVKLAIRKPDKTVVFQNGTVDNILSGLVSFVLETQSYVIPGAHVAEVMVYFDGGKVVVTRPFAYQVVQGILSDGAVESTSWYQDVNELQQLVTDLQIGVNKQLNQAIVAATTDATQAANLANQRVTELDGFETSITSQLADTAKKVGWVNEVFSGTRFIAHRGYSEYYPENTLKAYVEASKAGFFGWETDPWVSTDGVWFNMHDSTLDRTTTGTGSTTGFTIAQLKALKIDGGANATTFKGLTIPTIEEIYQLAVSMPEKPIILLNNRSTTPAGQQRTADLAAIIKKYNYEKRTFLFLGDYSSHAGLRAILPEVGICCDFGAMLPSNEQLDYLVTLAPNVMASVDYNVILNNPTVVTRCKSRDLAIQAHTVNDVNVAKSLVDMGVNSILTDKLTEVY